MREYEHIADEIAAAVARDSEVLDWGCGFGQVTALLQERGVRTVAMDYRHGSPSMPRQMALELYPHIDATITTDPINIPFDTASFDVTVSVGVLEHVPDPVSSLAEIARVLRPGGALFVYKLPNRRSWIEAIAKRSGRYYHGKGPTDIVYTRQGAKKLLEETGFEVHACRLANMLPLTSIGLRVPRATIDFCWKANRLLARLPLINAMATNIECVAIRGSR
jgi:SAM-dependent methyltransferase